MTQFKLSPIVVRKTSDVLASELRPQGALPPGPPLPVERDLVARTGLGRASVREALRILVSESLFTTWRPDASAARLRISRIARPPINPTSPGASQMAIDVPLENHVANTTGGRVKRGVFSANGGTLRIAQKRAPSFTAS